MSASNIHKVSHCVLADQVLCGHLAPVGTTIYATPCNGPGFYIMVLAWLVL